MVLSDRRNKKSNTANLNGCIIFGVGNGIRSLLIPLFFQKKKDTTAPITPKHFCCFSCSPFLSWKKRSRNSPDGTCQTAWTVQPTADSRPVF